jgi:putative transposase
MSQSLSRVLIHIIFSTKNRFAFFTDGEMKKRMHAYLARVFNEQDSPAIEVGGTEDHVHFLCLLSRKHAISDVVKEAKVNSSSRAMAPGGRGMKFSSHSGYGAFLINQSQIEPLRKYIQAQAEHHCRKSFQEEYLEFLGECRIPYDERYLWE